MTLSERVANLAGPDRAVDAEVWAVLYGPPDAYVKESPFNGEWCVYYTDVNGKEQLCERRKGQPPMTTPFTASLDTAMSVVPEGWGWTVSNTGHARCLHPERSTLDCEAYAADPILALLSAALKAGGK